MPKIFLYSIKDFELKNKTVFIRTDFNILVENNVVQDHIRFQASLETIRYALKKQAKVIIGSHRGRPTKKNKNQLSLEPFGYCLGEHLNCEVLFIEDIDSVIPSVLLASLNEKKILLLENLRFHEGEKNKDADWAQRIASYIDIYINEAFSVSHRNDMSISLLPQKIKNRGQGFLMKKEREAFDYIRDKSRSRSPLMLLVGGVKVSDKIKTINCLVDRLHFVLFGGVMAYTFLKAQGVNVGEAIVQTESLSIAKKCLSHLKMCGKQFLLPVDHVVIPVGGKSSDKQITPGPEVPKGFYPLDIGPKTIKLFSEAVSHAGTVFWNGPFGKCEDPEFSNGTAALCEVLANCKNTFRMIGGGDSISAILKLGKKECFDYISTGGGAALEYLEKGQLPGIQSLLSEKKLPPLDLSED